MLKTSRLMTILLVLVVSPAALAQTIETISNWNGSDAAGYFGVPNSASYGQVVTAAGAVLRSFSFELRVPTTVAFRGEVYAWDGTKATGPALYESAPMSTTDDSVFQRITIDTGGVSVEAGQAYILFLTTSRDQSGHSGQGFWGFLNANLVPGKFVRLGNGTDVSKWTTTTWDTTGTDDLAFQATFSDQPVPATSHVGLALLALLLATCGAIVLRPRA